MVNGKYGGLLNKSLNTCLLIIKSKFPIKDRPRKSPFRKLKRLKTFHDCRATEILSYSSCYFQ